jgi:hypothetical protein
MINLSPLYGKFFRLNHYYWDESSLTVVEEYPTSYHQLSRFDFSTCHEQLMYT